MTRTTVSGGARGVRMAAMMSLALVTVAASLTGCGSSAPAPPTARVERGQVSTKVSASGALAAVTSQGLAFPKGAQLTGLMVKVGDTVQAGQVLAREDDFAFNQALNQQRAALNQQQAVLDRVTRTPLVSGDRKSVEAAKKILSATQANGRAIHQKDENATSRARQAQDLTQRQLRQAQDAYRYCLRNPPQSGALGGANSGLTNSLTDGTMSGSSGSDMDSGTDPSDPSGSSSTRVRRSGGRDSGSSRDSDSDLGGSDLGSSSGGSSSSSGRSRGSDGGSGQAMLACSSQRGTLNSAQTAYLQAKTAYDAAKKTEDVDDTSSRIQTETSRQGVVNAQNSLNSDRSDFRPNVDAQAALVASAQAAVGLAQRDVNNAVLFAPVAGTISAINGAVGEFMTGAQSGTTALAPGTDAGIPGVGAAATSDQSASNSSISATRPGGGAFIVMNNINTFQVVVPFEESDAAKVSPNQRVQVSFDAIPDLTRDGTVLSVSPGGVNISGVTNYYATILLTDSDPRLRSGQTAEAGVLVNALDNVLVVPNSAVIKQGGRSFVNTPGPNGTPQQTEFQPGLVGDDNTQVLSGLREGQPIQLPQATVSPSTSGGGGGGGGGRGGG